MPIERITLFCFGASYAVALLLEFVQLYRPRAVPRLVIVGFAAAGLLAHSLFLLTSRPTLASQFGSMLFLAWILAVFYLYGSVHHRRAAWGIFVLPLVLGLILLADTFERPGTSTEKSWVQEFVSLRGVRFWLIAHLVLFLLAAVGVSVGFVASIMYLVQVRRLRTKRPPGRGPRLLSLERLETMNRRAINLAFPLFTASVLIGTALMVLGDGLQWHALSDPKTLGALVLWVVFALLLYLRYGVHLRGRYLSLLTIAAFGLLLLTLAVQPHTFGPGGSP